MSLIPTNNDPKIQLPKPIVWDLRKKRLKAVGVMLFGLALIGFFFANHWVTGFGIGFWGVWWIARSAFSKAKKIDEERKEEEARIIGSIEHGGAQLSIAQEETADGQLSIPAGDGALSMSSDSD